MSRISVLYIVSGPGPPALKPVMAGCFAGFLAHPVWSLRSRVWALMNDALAAHCRHRGSDGTRTEATISGAPN